MANEFKVKKGLIIEGGSTAGSTLLDIQGTSGQLFSVTDILIGSIFSVNDISGIPLLDVNSSGKVVGGVSTTIGSALIQEGITSLASNMVDWDRDYVSGEILKNQLSGEDITAGMTVVYDNTRWYKTNASDVTYSAGMLGVALTTTTSSTGGEVMEVLLRGFVETAQVESTSMREGTPLYLWPDEKGHMTSTTPTTGVARLVGYCYRNPIYNNNSRFILRFDPDNTWVEL